MEASSSGDLGGCAYRCRNLRLPTGLTIPTGLFYSSPGRDSTPLSFRVGRYAFPLRLPCSSVTHAETELG